MLENFNPEVLMVGGIMASMFLLAFLFEHQATKKRKARLRDEAEELKRRTAETHQKLSKEIDKGVTESRPRNVGLEPNAPSVTVKPTAPSVTVKPTASRRDQRRNRTTDFMKSERCRDGGIDLVDAVVGAVVISTLIDDEPVYSEPVRECNPDPEPTRNSYGSSSSYDSGSSSSYDSGSSDSGGSCD